MDLDGRIAEVLRKLTELQEQRDACVKAKDYRRISVQVMIHERSYSDLLLIQRRGASNS